MRIVQAFSNLAKQSHRLSDSQRAASPHQILDRTVLKKLHDIVRRFRFPANAQNLHDMSSGRHVDQVLDFAAEQRPIHAASVQVEFHRNLPPGVQIAAQPNLAERPLSKQPFNAISRHLSRWDRQLKAKLLGLL